ncbi:MAG: trimethylamine methyltransferase family protein [bacterium]
MVHEKTHRANTNPHAPLSDAELQKMIDAIFRLMRETGVKFDTVPEVMDILSDAKCDISSNGIVKFPTDLVRGCIDSTAKSVKVWDRNCTGYIEFSLAHSVFMTDIGGVPNVMDIDTGERRPTTREDLAMIARVADALPDVDGLDVWCRISEIDRFALIAANSMKPQHVAFEDARALQAAIEMAVAIRGGKARLKEKPFFVVSVSGMPMYYCKNDLDQLRILAENDIPSAVGTLGIGGASAPMTIAGNLVNCFASDLAGLVLTQLFRQGLFCMIGSTITFMDPRSGNIGAMNECTLAEMAKHQIGQHLGLPQHYSNAGVTLSKAFDQRAALDIAHTMTAGIYSQSACCVYLGGIDGLQAYSLHALLLCNELVGTARRMWKGIRVDDETLALDLTHKLGPHGDYLAEMHTAIHCRKELSPIKYLLSQSFETWQAEGSKDLKQMIDEDLRKILATHQPEPFSPSVQKQLDAIVEKYRMV